MANGVGQRMFDFRWWLGGLGIFGVTAVLVVFAGPVGLAIGAGLIAVRYWSSSIVAFVVGHIVLLLVPQLTELAFPLVAVEAGLACLLVESVSRTGETWRTAIVMLGSFALLAGFVAAGWTSFEASWGVGLLLGVVVGVVAYGLHRYERLTLSLTEAA